MRSYHNPFHLRLDKAIYFITARTCGNQLIFNRPEKRSIINNILKNLAVSKTIKLFAWVIMDSHYHLLFELYRGDELAKMMNQINGRSSFEVNKLDGTRGRKIWYQYWDSCVRGEKDFWRRFNYIHYNPVKHGYCSNMEAWDFSSYGYYKRKMGHEWLMDCFSQYPVIDFGIDGDVE